MLRFMNFRLERSLLLLLAALVIVGGCRRPAPDVHSPDSVTLMTFNVENLFDTVDDENRDDETYLPISAKGTAAHKAKCAWIEREVWRNQCLYWDWSETVLKTKLERIAEAIEQVNGGLGPDVIAFQEVENIRVLERLRKEHLGAANYLPAILIEGQDNRGIDVAFLSRLPLVAEPVLHPIPFTGFPDKRVRDTRGILQADFALPNGDVLTGFAVHFPAPYHPFAMREQAYEFLAGLKATLPPGRHAFAAGDFNTTRSEIASRKTLARLVRPDWQVVHEFGCDDCRGTNYYAPDDSWSFLDTILFASDEWQIRPGSVAIANQAPHQTTRQGTPSRFRLGEMTGVSDHWPVVVTIELATP